MDYLCDGMSLESFETWGSTAVVMTNCSHGRKPSRSVSFDVCEQASNTHFTVRSCSQQDKHRSRVERYIQRTFQSAHNAKLNSYLPELFSVHDQIDTICAAVGVRFTGRNNTFLEQYLASPIEQLVSDLSHSTVSRQKIAEVGNLACLNPGYSRSLLAFLPCYLHEKGIEWAVCTGTSAVRALLKRMKFDFYLIDKADPNCLGEEQHHWGSYYQNNPCVMAINIPQAYRMVQASYAYKEISHAQYS
jgi:hypothetical protein